MTEALIGTCILAITTVIFVWVCSEYQIYNNEHSAEEKLIPRGCRAGLQHRGCAFGLQLMMQENIRRKC